MLISLCFIAEELISIPISVKIASLLSSTITSTSEENTSLGDIETDMQWKNMEEGSGFTVY